MAYTIVVGPHAMVPRKGRLLTMGKRGKEKLYPSVCVCVEVGELNIAVHTMTRI